ncbi:restriction endonuclease subunit S [Acetivibrio cellulolyticus]|uniref:restriction endonuclease subunit S n=1 Tax=Acetivibrio cellulolyticus TaxID=35830 RepID=UPI0001E30553|nr:restriction endonuclease subunit S [Acetivibrio cellulolyticus]
MKIDNGYKMTEVGVIPEDWEVVDFGDIVEYTKGFAFKSGDYCQDGVRIIRVSDTTYDSIKDDNPIYIDTKNCTKYRKWILIEHDLIFSTVGSKPPMYDSLVGKVIMITKRYAGSLLNQNAVLIRSKEKNVFIQKLLLNHFRTNRYIRYIETIFRGNANQASITLKELFKFPIPLPINYSEQKAIATALSDTDELIQSLEKLIAKKRAIKQGVMQKLLTGKKRLQKFNQETEKYKNTEVGLIPEDWNIVKIKNIALISTGSRNTQDKIDSGEYPFFVRSQTVERINSYSYDGEAVLTAGDGVGTGKVFHYISGKFDFHQRVYKISDFKDNIDGYFFFLYFKNSFYNRIMQMTAKSSVDSVRMEMIAEMQIPIPPTQNEQKAIASILSDMDAEITALETKLEKYKKIKQGMMQNLLTGKIRLV